MSTIPDFPAGAGYNALAIVYIVFAVANWLAPSIIAYTGPRLAMIVGGIVYR